MDDINLQEEQLELLYEARRIERSDSGSPVVVSEDAINAVREALSAPLAEIGISEDAIDTMGIESLAMAITPPSDDEDAAVPLSALAQTPETGAQGDDPEPEPEGVEALSASEISDARDKLESADKMESRTPRFSEDLRNEALAMVPGCDDLSELEAELA